LPIVQGGKLEFLLVDEHIEVRLKSSPTDVPTSGFGMLKSQHPPVPVDFDLAILFRR
jgi:hypothetical protein